MHSIVAPKATLCGNPPTIGSIPKFKKIPSNINTNTGILNVKEEGDWISPGNVSYSFFLQQDYFLDTCYLFNLFSSKIPLLTEMFSGVAIVKMAD